MKTALSIEHLLEKKNQWQLFKIPAAWDSDTNWDKQDDQKTSKKNLRNEMSTRGFEMLQRIIGHREGHKHI